MDSVESLHPAVKYPFMRFILTLLSLFTFLNAFSQYNYKEQWAKIDPDAGLAGMNVVVE